MPETCPERFVDSMEVLGVNACFCPLLPGHLWPLRAVHLYELRLCRASGEGKEARALSDVRTGSLGPHLRGAFFLVFMLASLPGLALTISGSL